MRTIENIKKLFRKKEHTVGAQLARVAALLDVCEEKIDHIIAQEIQRKIGTVLNEAEVRPVVSRDIQDLDLCLSVAKLLVANLQRTLGHQNEQA